MVRIAGWLARSFGGCGLLDLFLLAWGGGTLALHVTTAALPPPRHARRPGRRTAAAILVPLQGERDASPRFFTALRRQLRPDDQVLICCARDEDGAVAPARAFVASLAGGMGAVLIGDEAPTGNPKLDNLVKGFAAADRPLLILVDGGLDLPPGYLDDAVAQLGNDIGLVSAAKAGCEPSGLAAEIECAFLNGHQLRWLELADRLGGITAVGGVMTLTAEVFARMGGVTAMAAASAEDHAAALAVRRLGLRTRLIAKGAPHPVGKRRFAEIWGRQLRWARHRKRMVPIVFALEPLAGLIASVGCLTAGLTALWGLTPLQAGFWGATQAGLWMAAETVWLKQRRMHFNQFHLVAMMARELIMPGVALHALAGRDIWWRGRRMGDANGNELHKAEGGG